MYTFVMDISGYQLVVNWAKQNRHILKSPNYLSGLSVLEVDPEMLVKQYAGRGTPIKMNGVWTNKERFEHTNTIGTWNSSDGQHSLPTKRGVFHYSKTSGIHIVPARPADFIF